MRRKPRRSPELRRLDALGIEGRRAEVARIIAEVDQPAPVDVEAAVARVLDQRELARAEAAEQAAYDKGRAPDRRPCARCGIESSTGVKRDRSEMPLWHPDDGGRCHCGACHSELSFDRLGLTDADRKVAVALRLLGLDKNIPMAAAGSSHLFAGLRRLWHYECSDAPPAQHPDGRWQHIDRAQLRSDFDAIVGAWHGHTDGTPPPPPSYGPCPACGTERSYRTPHGIIRCGTCSYERQYIYEGVLYQTGLPSARPAHPGERTPRDRDAAELLGLPLDRPAYGPDPLAGLAEQTAFEYFAESDPQEPNDKPWGHLNIKRMRRMAKVSV
jgi:hypothetical protein